MQQAAVVVAHAEEIGLPLLNFLKVALVSLFDVFPVQLDVRVPVLSCVLVHESQGMHQLVHYRTDASGTPT